MRMRISIFSVLLWISSCLCSQAGSPAILKVLPHYLDLEGRHALSPSLYERDAYQAFLRQHPEKRSGLRFDVNWKAKRKGAQKNILRIELRSSSGDIGKPVVLEQIVRPGRFFSTWSSLRLSKEDYASFGQLTAWRVTLWQQGELLAEEKSFLW